MTGEFFGTFVIPLPRPPGPALPPHGPRVHEAPHRPRPPTRCSGPRADNGKGMPNYADLVGFRHRRRKSATLYIPGRQTRATASAEVTATALANRPPLTTSSRSSSPTVARPPPTYRSSSSSASSTRSPGPTRQNGQLIGLDVPAAVNPVSSLQTRVCEAQK